MKLKGTFLQTSLHRASQRRPWAILLPSIQPPDSWYNNSNQPIVSHQCFLSSPALLASQHNQPRGTASHFQNCLEALPSSRGCYAGHPCQRTLQRHFMGIYAAHAVNAMVDHIICLCAAYSEGWRSSTYAEATGGTLCSSNATRSSKTSQALGLHSIWPKSLWNIACPLCATKRQLAPGLLGLPGGAKSMEVSIPLTYTQARSRAQAGASCRPAM